jgi:hypothetical protein
LIPVQVDYSNENDYWHVMDHTTKKADPWGLISGSGDILTSKDFAGIHFNI